MVKLLKRCIRNVFFLSFFLFRGRGGKVDIAIKIVVVDWVKLFFMKMLMNIFNFMFLLSKNYDPGRPVLAAMLSSQQSKWQVGFN